MKEKRVMYVLAMSGAHVELVLESLDANAKVGDSFDRDRSVYGPNQWVIIKVYGPTGQSTLAALQELMGFDALSELFSTRYNPK